MNFMRFLWGKWILAFVCLALWASCAESDGEVQGSDSPDVLEDVLTSEGNEDIAPSGDLSSSLGDLEDTVVSEEEDAVVSGDLGSSVDEGMAKEDDIASSTLDASSPPQDEGGVVDIVESPGDSGSELVSEDSSQTNLPPCPQGLGLNYAVYDIAYAETDPRNILDLFLPADPGPWPLIIWIHGGGWKGGTKDTVPAQALGFLNRGYAIASVEYRLSDHPWPAPVADVKAAVRWLRANASNWSLDPDRFAAMGSSAGGHLAAMLGATEGVGALEDLAQGNSDVSSGVQVVVDYYGPTELLKMDEDTQANGCPESALCHLCAGSPESLLVGCEGGLDTCADKAVEASPVTWVDSSDVPFLIVHGKSDCTVPTPQSGRLHTLLVEAGVSAQLVEVEGAGHNVNECSTYDTRAAVREFLDTQLRGCMPEAEPVYENIDQCMVGECSEEFETCKATEGCMDLEQCFRDNFGTAGYIASCINGIAATIVSPHKKLFDCAKPAGCYAMFQ